MLLLAFFLIWLTGPDEQEIGVNREQVVSIRAPRKTDDVYPGIHCLIHTTDGKVVTVTETCDEVREQLEGD